MRDRLRARTCDSVPCQRRGSDRGIINDAIADHCGDRRFDCDRINGNLRNLPCKLRRAR